MQRGGLLWVCACTCSWARRGGEARAGLLYAALWPLVPFPVTRLAAHFRSAERPRPGTAHSQFQCKGCRGKQKKGGREPERGIVRAQVNDYGADKEHHDA